MSLTVLCHSHGLEFHSLLGTCPRLENARLLLNPLAGSVKSPCSNEVWGESVATDYYDILGVSRSASSEEIQKGYRKEARKCHPDLHEDKQKAKERFQKVQRAYEVLSDPEKRRMYDQMGPDFEKMGGGHNPFGGAAGPGGPIDLNQIFGGGGGGGAAFEQLFRQFGGMGGMGGMPGGMPGQHPGQQAPPKPNLDIEQSITIPFATAILGGNYQVSVKRSTGKVETIDVKIPIGIESGKKIRLRGLGHAAPRGERGDLLIKIRISAHPCFSRVDNSLMVKLPVTLSEAIFGAKIDLPTPHGTITVTIPPGSTSGKPLRLKGMGVKPKGKKPGDLMAEIQIIMPKDLSKAEQKKLNEALSKIQQDSPRNDLIW